MSREMKERIKQKNKRINRVKVLQILKQYFRADEAIIKLNDLMNGNIETVPAEIFEKIIRVLDLDKTPAKQRCFIGQKNLDNVEKYSVYQNVKYIVNKNTIMKENII